MSREYVLEYGRSARSRPYALFNTARAEAMALSRPDSYGGEVRVVEMPSGDVVGVARRGSFRPTSARRDDPRSSRGRARARLCPVGTHVQTLLFPRTRFTRAQARAWAERNRKKATKVHTKGHFHRLRQEPTSHFKKESFRTIRLPGGEGVEAVIGCPARGQRRR